MYYKSILIEDIIFLMRIGNINTQCEWRKELRKLRKSELLDRHNELIEGRQAERLR